MQPKFTQTIVYQSKAITPDNWRDKMKQEELNLILENHKKWLNDDGGIRANLWTANLSGASLRSTIGNQGQIITIQTDVWQIVYTSDVMQICCQRHSINDWLVFSDDHISKMDSKALEFWKKWKPILVLILERNK